MAALAGISSVFVDQQTLNDLVSEVHAAFAVLGVPAEVRSGRVDAENLGHLEVAVDGRTIDVVVVTRADLRPAAAAVLPELVGGVRSGPPRTGLVVADRLAEHTREVLRERGWGWLDRRRGQLRLWAPGLRLDATLPPPSRPVPADEPRVRNPFSASGQRLALWLLLHPDEPASPRAIAREIGVSAGQISNLLQAFAAQALLRRDRAPLVPELFWALAEHWHPRRHAVLALPPAEQLAAAPELKANQWVVGDTCAAAGYGAPVAVREGYPCDLYVPDHKTLSWVLNRCDLAPDATKRGATVAVAPVPMVSDRRFTHADPSGGPWPLAHPVVVALDLAADRARGREVLEAWEPPSELEVARVW